MSADRIMALADSGTPGPWRFTDSETVYGVDQAGLTIVSGEGDPIANVADEWYEPEGQDEDATPFYDAAKIVAAVNALPKVAALVAAIDALPANRMPKDHDPECDGVYCMHPVVALYDRMTAARDELVVALGVDSE